MPRKKIYNPDNEYDVAAAHRGLYRCPHIGVYCQGSVGERTIDCLGKEECWWIKFQPWLAGCFAGG